MVYHISSPTLKWWTPPGYNPFGMLSFSMIHFPLSLASTPTKFCLRSTCICILLLVAFASILHPRSNVDGIFHILDCLFYYLDDSLFHNLGCLFLFAIPYFLGSASITIIRVLVLVSPQWHTRHTDIYIPFWDTD
jgi:hypothetical protein